MNGIAVKQARKDQKMLLFYIRHGDPIYNPDSLTPLGERQAEAVAHRLSLFGLDRIYASTSNRAKLTANPTCEMLKLPMTELDWCNEGHAWNELSLPDSKERKQWIFQNDLYRPIWASNEIRALGHEWYTHKNFRDTSCRAGMERIRREADAFLEELGYRRMEGEGIYEVVKSNNERVALFAHQGFGLAFLSCVLNIPYPVITSHFDMGHSGMTVIEFKEIDGIVIPKMLQLSNDSHLYHEGILTGYQNEIRF